MTAKRLDWLKELEQNGIGLRSGKGPIGCACMRVGWTEWAYDESGKNIGERLTDAGRAALSEANQEKGHVTE